MATEPLMICSENGAIGLEAGLRVLRAGGRALDALEAAALPVELNRQDRTVGIGGVPNLLKQVQLDAGIMDGATLSVGAVAALEGYLEPVRVARKVLELLPHSLLVGPGAARFAQEHGFEQAEHLTAEAEAQFRGWTKIPSRAWSLLTIPRLLISNSMSTASNNRATTLLSS